MKTQSQENRNNVLRDIPQVEKILQYEGVKEFIPEIGRGIVVSIIQNEIERFRDDLQKGNDLKVENLVIAIQSTCRTRQLEKLQRVINGTGVIIHTNLGRSPISSDILKRVTENLSGYCNLEMHLPTQKRGKRGGLAEELICQLTGAEDAVIVNNNASSIFLILNQFAQGKEVLVSRGELIQIGGGFRIPDILNQSGARLVEVGTTNITELDDYRSAITENTGMIFSAHLSNYRIEGFAHRPSLKDIATLKNEELLFVRDLGSGNFINDDSLPRPFEPTVAQEMAQGADLVCFSGDKLMGGCQAGIIIGKKELVAKLRKNPLMRMLRVDKITYFILQETLLHYTNSEIDSIALWNIIFQDKQRISRRVSRFLRVLSSVNNSGQVSKISLQSTFGGGSVPGMLLESVGVSIDIPGFTGDELYRRLSISDKPIIGYIEDDIYRLDFRTVQDNDVPYLSKAVSELIKE